MLLWVADAGSKDNRISYQEFKSYLRQGLRLHSYHTRLHGIAYTLSNEALLERGLQSVLAVCYSSPARQLSI